MKPSYYTFQSNILGAQTQESESILGALIKSPPSYQPCRNCSGSNEAIADRRDEQQAQVQSLVRHIGLEQRCSYSPGEKAFSFITMDIQIFGIIASPLLLAS